MDEDLNTETAEDIASGMADEDLGDDPQDEGQQADDLPDGDGGDDPEGDAPADADDPEEEWEAGGQKYKVKKSELRSGYMKGVDYSQKTAKVAEQERAVAQFAQHLQQERQHAANQLDVLLQGMQQELAGGQPDPALIEANPQEFLRQQALYHQRAQKFQQALQARQALAQQQQAQAQQQHAQRVRIEGQKLLEAVPEWRSEKAAAAEQKEIAQMLSTYGYSPEEVGSLADHRAVLLARDALKWRKQQQVSASKQKPPLPKPVKPGAAGTQNTNSAAARARERAARNPNDLDSLAGLLGTSGW